MSLLKVLLIGNLGRDAEVRELSDGRKVISFSVAHSEKFRDRNGVATERTTWVRCSYFRPAESIGVAQYLKKGTQVYVEGVPSINKYTNKDGLADASFECLVNSLQLLGSKKEENVGGDSGYSGGQTGGYSGGNQPAQNSPTNYATQSDPTLPSNFQAAEDDDLPF
jgi:single-strand DNA-binding protein